jgi:hypothetical protein
MKKSLKKLNETYFSNFHEYHFRLTQHPKAFGADVLKLNMYMYSPFKI